VKPTIETFAALHRSVITRKIDTLPNASKTGSDNLLIMYTVQYSLVVFLFVANLFADAAPEDVDKGMDSTARPCPRQSASYFSKLIYAWAVPLMWTGTTNVIIFFHC
jgi:hypothetical protein